MRAWMWIPLTLMTLAGCLAAGPAESATDPVAGCAPTAFESPDIAFLAPTDDPLALVNDSADAFDFTTYNLRTCSLAAIGHTPLRFNNDGTGDPHRYIGEIDMRGDMGAVAVLGNGETPTVYLLDISDRADPKVLSTIPQIGTYLTDVKISDTGRYLFTASQGSSGQGELAELPALTANAGFSVYDIADPAAPRYMATYDNSPNGCHMLSSERIGDTEVVVCISDVVRVWGLEEVSPGNLVPLGYVPYVPSDGAGCAVPLPVPCVGVQAPHDATVQVDPVTGQRLMMVSHWDSGLRIVDLSDAPQATELGKWTGEGATHYSGHVHSAMMVYANGTRYILATPEYTGSGGADTVPSIWVLDATDLTAPKLVAEWFHPGEHPSQGLFLTTHQWQVAPAGPDVPLDDVRIYLTMNHAGIWVLGLEDILQGDNLAAIKGFHLGRTPLDPDNSVGNAVLSTWDVNVVDGYIYGSDRATGLWIFHYEGDTLGDASRTGFA